MGKHSLSLFSCRKRVHGLLRANGAPSSWVWLLGFQFCVRPGGFAAVFFLRTKDLLFFLLFFFSPLCFFLTLMIFEVIGVRSLVEHLQASRYKVFSGAGRTSSKGLAERAFVHRPTEVLVSR